MVIVIADQTVQWIVRLAGDESSSDVSWGCRLISEWLSDKSDKFHDSSARLSSICFTWFETCQIGAQHS